MINEKPISKPACINFSSGPCAKRPGGSVNSLNNALLGRSHRSKEGKIKLKEAIDKTIDILEIPEGYKVGIVAGSDTGAIEMAMWNLLGWNPVEILAWEVFGNDWKKDIEVRVAAANIASMMNGIVSQSKRGSFSFVKFFVTADAGQWPNTGEGDKIFLTRGM